MMSRKPACALFLACNLLVAAVLYAAATFALGFTVNDLSTIRLLALLTAAGFLLFAGHAAVRKFLPGYPQISPMLINYAHALAYWTLVPVGLFIGPCVGRILSVNEIAAAIFCGWFLFPIAIPVLFSPVLTGRPRMVSSDPDFVRGTYMMSMAEACRRAMRLKTKPSEPQFFWGGIHLPEWCSRYHFAIIGVTGSGKSLTLRLLMQSVLPHITPGSDWRAFIYDPKNEFLPILDGMELSCPVKSLHPYDAQSVAWDIGHDIDDRSVAQQLAKTLIPDPGGANTFFYQASQAILSAIMEAFILLAPDKWTFRHVLLLVSDIEATKRVLKSIPELERAHNKYFRDLPNDTIGNILVTLATETERLEPIAALWDRASERVSLKKWARESYILHIATDKEVDEPLNNINRVLLQRISQIFTKEDDEPLKEGEARRKRGNGRTWIFIDEAKFAGKIPGLDDLLTTGRSFGARVCLCVQDVSGLQHVYGDKAAEEILGGTCTTARFATANPATADYNARVIGKTERIERRKSTTRGTTYPGGGGPQSTSESSTEAEERTSRDAVSPEQFMQVYPADDDRFYGFYTALPLGRWEGWFQHRHVMKPIPEMPFIERPASHQYLRPWNDADKEEVGPVLWALITGTHPDQPPSPAAGASHLDAIVSRR